MNEWHVPGLSIAVLAEGEITWQRGLGVRSASDDATVDENTIFCAASLTKPLFAYVVLRLVDEGLLDLDTPLVEYAPREYIEERFLRHSMDAPGFRREWFVAITARMALSHSSGLQHFGLKSPVEIRSEPGTEFYYSSNGIEYLRYVVEYLKDSSIDRVVSEYAFLPLGMTSSSLVWRDTYQDNSAAGHDQYGSTTGAIEHFKGPTAQASLYTNARDYAAFLNALSDGVGLQEDTYNQLITPQIETNPAVHWGLGVGLETPATGKGIWHFGDAGTYTSYFYVNLETRVGFVFFANSHYGLAMLNGIFGLLGAEPHPALSFTVGEWSFAEDYLSPAMAFKCRYMNGDTEGALAHYHTASQRAPEGKRIIKENQLLGWAYDYLRSGAHSEAIQLLQLLIEAYYPDGAPTCTVLSNQYSASKSPEAVVAYLEESSAIVDDERLVWLTRLAKAELQPISLDSAAATSFSGSYEPYRITYSDNSLHLVIPDQQPFRMIALGDSTFALGIREADFIIFRFTRDVDGSAVLKIARSGGEPRVFRRSD